MDVPVSEAKKRANNKYTAKTYKQVNLRFRKDEYDHLMSSIKSSGESFNSFVVGAIYDKLDRLKEPTER